MMRMRGKEKKRWVFSVGVIAIAVIAVIWSCNANRAAAASETAISNQPWAVVKPVLEQKIGTGYQAAGKCTGYVYWCLKNGYGVDWGENSPVEGLEEKLINAGITKIAEGTSGTVTSDMKPGDIIIFSMGSDRTHCAILGEGGILYHARSSVGVVAAPTLREWMSWPDEDKNCDRYVVYRGLQSTGTVSITKTSADTDMTDGNGCYSLAGAKYGLYQGSTLVGTLTTNEEGKASLANVPYGSYVLKEISPSKGYALDMTVYNITVTSAVTTKQVKEQPQGDPVTMLIHKIDREIHQEWSPDNRGQFAASLADAQYKVSYYDGYYTEETSFEEMIPLRTWVIRTDESGQASLNEEQLVEGDPFYYSSDGQVVLPLGTITLQEIKAPTGYVLDDTLHVRQVTSTGTEELVDTYLIPVHKEQIIRGDIMLIKVKDTTLDRLTGVPFTLTSRSTGESHSFMTDINGQASTEAEWNAHGKQTNEGSETAGVWFGNMAMVDDELGALPYDTYILDEQPCAANVGLTLLSGIEIKVYRHNQTIDLGTVTDDVIKIETSASDQATGQKETLASDHVVLVDQVHYEGLTAGREYVMEGTVHTKRTGNPLLVNGTPVESTVVFTPEKREGDVEIAFTFDASRLGGEDLVVFERLYTGGQLAAVHEDINNTKQTVRIKDAVIVEQVDTGDPYPWEVIGAINLMLLAGIGICAVLIKRRNL